MWEAWKKYPGKWLLGAALVLGLGLVLVLGGNVILPALSAARPLVQPQGTSTPQLVSLRASATDPKAGDVISLTATMPGLGQPYYTVTFKDDTPPKEPSETVPKLRIQHGNDLFYVDVSKILQFESINYEYKERKSSRYFGRRRPAPPVSPSVSTARQP